eukprot:CAMPEP_0172493484 /NCGR_PEP_ID=MMETSP1066-20121228/24947_1 /TAXON_ID=671091 /ORGANISM="Coscinodiscus wailesii, Strain CCMP2513" /LENGTH=492 /DNA_ID=CAMNT_0013263685 /DNA_START=198 /DNA_END=1676 /DNA_ORIENTATION=-
MFYADIDADRHDLENPLLPTTAGRHEEHCNGGNEPVDELPLSSPHDDDDNVDYGFRTNAVVPVAVSHWDGLPRETSILIKSLYFLEGLGASTWGRFAAIYFNLHGLSPGQIGLLGGLMPAVRTLAQPVWGVIADVWETRKGVYLLCRVAGTSVLLTMALPRVYESVVGIFVVSLLTVVFSSSGILDSYTLELLGERNKTKYGRYRLWCAVSWGAGAVGMGILTDRFGFEFNFALYGILGYLSCILIAIFVPNQQGGDTTEPKGSVIELVRLLLRPRVGVFCLELVLVGAAMGTVESLLFIYLVDDLGASTLLCGLSVGVTVLLELPIFWNADLLIRRMGHDGMVALAMACFAFRAYGYTLLTPESVTWVLCLEVMHGITFATFKSAIMDVTKILSQQTTGWNTTIPVLTSTLFQCVGSGLGSIIGGWAMEVYGSKAMYRGVSQIVFVVLLVHILGSLIVRCRSTNESFLPVYKECGNRCEKEDVDDDENAIT